MGNKQQSKPLLIEFLTQKQKIEKNKILVQFAQQQEEKEEDENEFDIVENPATKYKSNFQKYIYLPKKFITLLEIMGYIKAIENYGDEYEDISFFFQKKVKSYFIIYEDKKLENDNLEIELSYETTPVIEFIYKEKLPLEQFFFTLKYKVKRFFATFWKTFGFGYLLKALKMIATSQFAVKYMIKFLFPITNLFL